eukprot:comp18454_c0_seq1/m.19742 comp18454_c0_seq1/g.19742  ORF comp18454_c0_seq1/g.19742 comp18454_c0_seq1/m.19742 type:complete len:268 (-) comp18454_c0_seq1:643-1446(-)
MTTLPSQATNSFGSLKGGWQETAFHLGSVGYMSLLVYEMTQVTVYPLSIYIVVCLFGGLMVTLAISTTKANMNMAQQSTTNKCTPAAGKSAEKEEKGSALPTRETSAEEPSQPSQKPAAALRKTLSITSYAPAISSGNATLSAGIFRVSSNSALLRKSSTPTDTNTGFFRASSNSILSRKASIPLDVSMLPRRTSEPTSGIAKIEEASDAEVGVCRPRSSSWSTSSDGVLVEWGQNKKRSRVVQFFKRLKNMGQRRGLSDTAVVDRS